LQNFFGDLYKIEKDQKDGAYTNIRDKNTNNDLLCLRAYILDLHEVFLKKEKNQRDRKKIGKKKLCNNIKFVHAKRLGHKIIIQFKWYYLLGLG
jgi:hypothetical protein